MTIELGNFEKNAQKAIRHFWRNRQGAIKKQQLLGKIDQGERGSVTGGKNMNGFVDLVCKIVTANGLSKKNIHLQKRVLTLPGYFRPTKSWDLLIISESRLIAAIEFKSQVGPSFGNNFNNRAEEAIGTAVDLNTAYREGAFGDQTRPFVGWLMLCESCPRSTQPVRDRSPHFPVMGDFQNASYAERYHLLCKKLMQERLYDAAAFLLSERTSGRNGEYSELDSMTGLKAFVSLLASRVATEVQLR